MLDTILQIGKIFRESDNHIKHHRYINSLTDKEKGKTMFFNLPVKDDFTFDFDNSKIINDENIINNQLYYLKFKTSDSDGMVKYIFGDIYYGFAKGEEKGYYRLGDKENRSKAYRESSFFRGQEDAKDILYINENESTNIEKFRAQFKLNVKKIENILKYALGIDIILKDQDTNKCSIKTLLEDEDKLIKFTAQRVFSEISVKEKNKIFEKREISFDEIFSNKDELGKLLEHKNYSVYLHFDFMKKHWYQFDNELNLINEKLLEEFFEKTDGNNYIIKKYLYKTLSSPEKDYQFPNFQPKGRYKNKLFKDDELLNLFYAVDYSKKALIKIPNSDIKIIILPKGNNLEYQDYEKFSNSKLSLNNETENEEILQNQNNRTNIFDLDLLFKDIFKNEIKNIIQFDIIFSKQGGTSSPDVDLVEICGIEKSFLYFISERIKRIAHNLYEKRKTELKANDLMPLNIYYSFLKILQDNTSKKKKYQNHLYKVLPLIYSNSYYNDLILLPYFIENVQKNIRDGNPNYDILKYDFYFLTLIQNTNIEGDNLMKIKDSTSYQLGLLRGRLATPLRNEIKSFEKNYIGNLTRRMSNLKDVIKFTTFIEEKLTIHEVFYKDLKNISEKLAEKLKDYNGKFDKNECAFGFFESYFSYFKEINSPSEGSKPEGSKPEGSKPEGSKSDGNKINQENIEIDKNKVNTLFNK